MAMAAPFFHQKISNNNYYQLYLFTHRRLYAIAVIYTHRYMSCMCFPQPAVTLAFLIIEIYSNTATTTELSHDFFVALTFCTSIIDTPL